MKALLDNKLEVFKFHIFHLCCFLLLFYCVYLIQTNPVYLFILPFPILGLIIILIITSFINIIYRIFKRNIRRLLLSLTVIPLSFFYIYIGALCLYYWQDPNMVLERNYTKMMEVVELVKDEKIEVIEYGTPLSPKYSYLSNGGEIIIKYSDRNGYEVEFFIYRGLAIGSYSGLIYSEVHDIKESKLYNSFDIFKELAPNWYSVENG